MHLTRDQRTVTVTTSGVQIAGGNMRRKGLIIGSDPATRVDIFFAGTPIALQGIAIPANTTPMILLGDFCGCFLTDPVMAIVAAGTAVIGILEIFGDD